MTNHRYKIGDIVTVKIKNITAEVVFVGTGNLRKKDGSEYKPQYVARNKSAFFPILDSELL
jgi:ribosomal protein S1